MPQRARGHQHEGAGAENPSLGEVRAYAASGDYGRARDIIDTSAAQQRDVLREEAAVAASWRGDFLVSAAFVEEVRDQERLSGMRERLRAAERGFQEYLASL